MSSTTRDTIKHLVEDHFHRNGRLTEGEPIVAISASHKLHWANQAGISIEEVENHLNAVCEPAAPPTDFEVVPSYRMKGTA